MRITDDLNKIQAELRESPPDAQTVARLNDWKASYLGKNGKLAKILSSLGTLSAEEKKTAGKFANQIKKEIEDIYDAALKKLRAGDYEKNIEKVTDPTLPTVSVMKGSLHPLYDTLAEISDIFAGFGFDIARGPEIEDDYHNFEALNFPDAHPAKEMQDTFYIKQGTEDKSQRAEEKTLLRTHTSPVQIRVMKNAKPPFKFIAPGRVYRHEAIDSSHSCVFHQVEGFCVDKTTNLSDLKSVLELFIEMFFGKKLSIRFRPSFFPFTEPSVEVDMQCLMCMGKGCKVCKQSGHLEMLGAGMIHPNVLSNCGHNPDVWQGYAFGLGVERFAMLKHGIDDMRILYKNDLRFLRQF